MATGQQRRGGADDPNKKKKKRQQVRRHWKPSLARHIEIYTRTGENAKKKIKTGRKQAAEEVDDRGYLSDRADDPPDDRPVGPEPAVKRGSRWPLAALLFAGVALAAAIVVLIDRGDESRLAYLICRANPAMQVNIYTGTPSEFVIASDAKRHRLVRAAIQKVVATHDAHPDRLVAIALRDASLSFRALPQSEQWSLQVQVGNDAAETYESTIVDFLQQIISGVAAERAGALIGVRGLPVEPRAIDIAAAQRTNARYRPIIDSLDPFVADHAFLMGDTSVTEQEMVRSALPESLRQRNHRAILFQTNGRWRILVDPEVLANEQDGQVEVAGIYRQLVIPPAPGDTRGTPTLGRDRTRGAMVSGRTRADAK